MAEPRIGNGSLTRRSTRSFVSLDEQSLLYYGNNSKRKGSYMTTESQTPPSGGTGVTISSVGKKELNDRIEEFLRARAEAERARIAYHSILRVLISSYGFEDTDNYGIDRNTGEIFNVKGELGNASA